MKQLENKAPVKLINKGKNSVKQRGASESPRRNAAANNSNQGSVK